MRRRVTTLTLSVVAAFAAAVCASPQAGAAASQVHMPIVITPSSGCGLLTAYTAGPGLPAWSSPAPPCGTGPFTLAFNQGNTAPLADWLTFGWRRDGRQRPAGMVRQRARGSKDGLPDHRPAGNHDQTTWCTTISQLQSIADGQGWIGLIYWNGGTRAGAADRDRGRRGGFRSV